MSSGSVITRTGGRPSSWVGLVALAVAGTLVFFVFDALPFQDLPAHAGLIALRHRIATSPFDQHYFVYAPHLGPYSLFRFLGESLVGPVGPLGAVRITAAIPLSATALALYWARRRLHGDSSPTAAFYGLALGFGFMTILGFASYLLGVAVLLFALTLWLELLFAVDMGDGSAVARELTIAALSPFVLLAHGHAFVLFLALAGVSALATGNRWRRLLRMRALVPAVAFAASVAWQERVAIVPVGSVRVPTASLNLHFQGFWDKISLLVTPTLLTRWGVDIGVGLVVWAILIAATAATVRSLRAPTRDLGLREQASRSHSCALLAALFGLLVAFFALPHEVGWFGFVDGRLVPVLLYLAIMAVRRPALDRSLLAAFDGCAEFAAYAMVATAFAASRSFQAEAIGWREIIAAVPDNARLLNLPLNPNSDVFTAHPFVHYDKLALVARDVVVSDVWFHQGTAIYPTASNPALQLPPSYSESDLRFIDWPAYRLSDWDYVLVRTRPSSVAPSAPATLILAAHRGGWWLYRTARAAGDRNDWRARPE